VEDSYHATTQNRFYSDISNVNKNITVEAKLISPPTYFEIKGKGIFEIEFQNFRFSYTEP
jgi:hypothetical protein